MEWYILYPGREGRILVPTKRNNELLDMRQLTPKTANTMDVQRSEMVEANDDREFGCRSNQVVEEKKTKFTRETAILEHSLVQF